MNDLQGNQEWRAARMGKVTASRVADVAAKTKTGYGAGRGNYMAELIVERLTGAPSDSYVSPAMLWGTNTEPQARAAYEAAKGEFVDLSGFVPHPTISASGASPDGLVGEDGLIEIKCPNTATHIETLLGGNIPAKYVAQMQWQMACTGRKWCHFVSFDPRMPEDMRIFIRRLNRDDIVIADLEKEVVKFLAELDEKLDALMVVAARDAL
jgi:putative phage-type endonuclease